MKRDWIFGLLFTLMGVATLIYTIVGQSSFPVTQWITESINGLVFSYVIGFGLSETVAIAYAVFTFITVIVVCFAIGHKVSRLFSTPK